MKKLLFMLSLFSTGLCYAQTEEPKQEWREIIEPFAENVQLFSSLERERIPYGILSDYAMSTANLTLYDGKHEGDSILMDRDVLSEIYRTLQMGRIHESSAEHFISFEDYSKRWRTYRKNSLNDITDTIPTIYLSGIYYKYARLVENAIEEQKIRFVDNRLLDKYVNNVWQNPYETVATIAVAAPFNVFKSKNIKVALPQDLFLSNEYDLTDAMVDFEDGNGFQPFEFGQVIPVSYAQNGSYTWKFKFKDHLGDLLSTRIPIKIGNPIEITPLPSTSQFSTIFINNGNHDAILRIKHIPGNGKTITSPFIVAEGFDPETIFYPEYPQGGISYVQFINSVNKEAKVIQNTVGNIFSGQVVGETAKSLAERFGKVLQQRQSISVNRSDTSTSISTQLDSLIPASKISTLTQGMFVGAVSDNFEERIEQKIFHAEIVVDNEKVAAEAKTYKKIPQIRFFTDENGLDTTKKEIDANYKQIKQDVLQIVQTEMDKLN